jgi:putative DNA primase/helicase
VIERLLSISGEDTLTIDRKNLLPVSTKLDTRLMLLSNELPRLGDSSTALSSRMVILGLSETWLGREDHGLTGRLIAELPGILLHFALPGWQMLQEDGRFHQPESGLELVEELESLSSPIRAFVNERCVEDPAATIKVEALFADWMRWCESMHRENPGNHQTFGRNLRAALPHLRVPRPRHGEKRVRVYQGLRLRLPGEKWSATVRGLFYSTRDGEEKSSSDIPIRSAIGGTADHRGPKVPPGIEHPCVECGAESSAESMYCPPCWSLRQARHHQKAVEVPS